MKKGWGLFDECISELNDEDDVDRRNIEDLVVAVLEAMNRCRPHFLDCVTERGSTVWRLASIFLTVVCRM